MALSLDQQRELARLRREQADAAAAGLTLDQEKLDLIQELLDLERGLTETGQDRVDRLDKENDKLKQQVALGEDLKEQGYDQLGLLEKQYEQAAKDLELQKERLAVDLKRNIAAGQSKEAAEEEYLQKLKNLRLEEDALGVRKTGAEQGESAMKRFFGVTAKPKSLAANLFVNPKEFSTGFKAGASKMMNGMNLMTSTIDKVVEATIALAIEQDKSIVNFRKSTSATGEFDNNIRNLETSLRQAGVTSDEAAGAVQSLFVNVTGFTEMSEQTQEILGENVALLAELGVNADTSAQNIQFLTKVMGQGNLEAARTTRELLTFAQDLGVTGEKIASDFQKMGPLIARVGDDGIRAFRALEVQAKSTGMEIESMLKLVEGFDTFSGAAEHVGKLNAIMGGPYLNSLELVAETDPSERFRILSDRIRGAGVAFDSLDYYQKKAYTSALGLNDEMELALFLGGKMDQIAPPAKSAAQMEELAAQTAQFNTIMEELAQLGRSLAISLGPVVGAMKEILNFVGSLLTGFDKLTFGIGHNLVPALVMLGMAMAFGMGPIGWAAAAVFGIAGLAGAMADAGGGGKSIPGFSNGGITAGGPIMTGENGREIVVPPRNSTVLSNGETEKILSSPPTVNVKIYIGDKEMQDLVRSTKIDSVTAGPLYDSIMNEVGHKLA
jgi:hypothetical protein